MANPESFVISELHNLLVPEEKSTVTLSSYLPAGSIRNRLLYLYNKAGCPFDENVQNASIRDPKIMATGAAEADILGAENEYGLQDLARLPLLEQVHRLLHAIQYKYPYKETTAWKTLPLDQKKKMLNYIRDKRQVTQQRDVDCERKAGVDEEVKLEDNKASVNPVLAVKSDPYLEMLQQRSLRVASSAEEHGAALLRHPNSAYVAPAQVPHYTKVMPKYKPRWQVAEGEFFVERCACGIQHDTDKMSKKTSLMLHTISAMMSTFGDSTQSCVTAVEEVQALVGDHMRKVLNLVRPEVLAASSCLRTLVELFEKEAIYYGRWRDFRGETKHEENELEDVEEEELAEELDLFAVSETDDVFNEAFLERIHFADERTKKMEWSIYDMFARGRKLNFMNNKAQHFREWLGLGKISRASLEFLNFVAYHNIGRLVELAIKNRTGGVLRQLETPLMKNDIESVALAFLPAQPLSRLIDRPAAKTREVDFTAANKSLRVEAKSHKKFKATASKLTTGEDLSTKPDEFKIKKARLTSQEVETVKPTVASPVVSFRPTRLKRLR